MSSETDEEMNNYVTEALKTLKRFDPNKIIFSTWYTEFLKVTKDVKVPDSRKTEFFCSMLEPKILRSLTLSIHPTNPLSLPYDEAIDSFKACSAMKNQRVLRKRFRARKQHDDETIQMYAKNLKYIYKQCNYRYVDDAVLVEQFLDGLRNRDIAKHLQKPKLLVYKLAVGRALALHKKDEASTSKD
ncbi:hypothetical protein M0804_013284 [Polistes exclamans]|nr:hypothetical protein M0804_013284 [Polistes exclamans]